MSKRRIEMHRLQELVRLHRMKTGARETARLLGMRPNTERQYREALAEAGLLDGAAGTLPSLEELKAAVIAAHPPALPPQQVTSLERYREVIVAHVDKGLGPRAIFDRLRLEDADFDGSHSAVKRLCRALRRARGVQAEDVAIPVETAPGEIAQVDFGYVGKLYDPATRVLRKAWCFVMVLAYSRHMVARVVFDQTIETWLQLHVEAFAELGGVVETVVPDNLKAAVVRAAFGVDDQQRAQSQLPRAGAPLRLQDRSDAAVHAPEKKGKVESGVKYVKRNFFVGRQESRHRRGRRDLGRWAARSPGTRARHDAPAAARAVRGIERAALRALPKARFEPVVWKQATVHPDSHIAFDKRLYSVPWS